MKIFHHLVRLHQAAVIVNMLSKEMRNIHFGLDANAKMPWET